MYISSQRYINEETVQAKREARDYVVTVSPEFEIDGVVMQNVIDGHHSFAAAIADCINPEFIVATVQNDDRIALIESNIDDYLESSYIDADWYDIETGKQVF